MFGCELYNNISYRKDMNKISKIHLLKQGQFIK